MLLRDFYEQVYRPLRLSDSSTHCRYQYVLNIRRFSVFLGHAATLEDLSEESIARLCGSVREKKRSPATCNKIRSQLVALWNLAARKGYMRNFPEVGRQREYERVPVAWLTEQLDRLFESCFRESGAIGGVKAGDWWLAFHYVLYDCGTRARATLRLRWDDVDLEAKTALFRAENQKNRADQLFPLQADTVAALRAIRSPAREYVFHWPHHRQTLYNRYKRIRKRAGLPTGRDRGFHCLRKTFASYLEAKCPGAATEALGHSNRTITKRYLDPRVVGTSKPSDHLPRPKKPQ